MKKEKIRLQKYLSECEVASRRKSEELIINGNVKINGRKAVLGDKIDPYKDLVTVKGKRVNRVEEKVYLMLYKPRGFINTMSDERNRKCVADLIKDVKQKVYPVGRLDKDSEGLLLLTNDGDFSNTMMHPKTHIPKTYRVTVREKVEEDKLEMLKKGVVIDGKKTAPCEIEIIQQEDNRTVLLFVLYEGRNREIRKMCESVNYTVIRLKRVAYGNLKLGMLQTGKWRYLHENEVAKLIALANKTKY
ncbi:MAG: pseudouridine synthase [Acutalibacteraceae bacterium]|nr:pseudouridine synthase [Acutalibacteraceae bacterium]